MDPNIIDKIELIVIDNDSKDNTKEVVSAFIDSGQAITYFKNESNIGLDGNITRAFEVANGKYVQVLGDDDYWIPGKLNDLIVMLAQVDAGVIYLKPYSFIDDNEQKEFITSNAYYLFKDGNQFLEKINIMSTFTSSNVFNKELVISQPDFVMNRFLGTDVNLLNWIFTAALAAKVNVLTKDYFIGSKADNNSGYKFFKVFGINFNLVLDYFKANGLNKYVADRINYVLTVYFFPKYLKNLNNDKWAYDDNKEEILAFLKKYRGGDQLNQIFLTNKGGLLTSSAVKSLIKSYHLLKAKSGLFFGLLSGKISKAVIK